MFNWLSESCVAHVCFEVVFAIVVAFFDRCFFRPSFIFVSVVSFSFCMHAAAAAVRFSSSDAKLCVCVNSVHWVCDIYYVWWWKRFVYFMYAQNNKQQQQGKLSSESFTQKSAKNTKMKREKKWKTATKNNGNSNKIENDSELSEKESHFHTHTLEYYVYENVLLSLTHDQIRTYRKARDDETTTATSQLMRWKSERARHRWRHTASTLLPTTHKHTHHHNKSPLNGVHTKQQWHITMVKWQAYKASKECKNG